MTDPVQAPRVVRVKIKFKSSTLDQFIERYAVDTASGGIFIRTKEPLAVGTQMRFEFQLRDATPLITGEGTVVWIRENDPDLPGRTPGMGIRYDRIAEGGQAVLEMLAAAKAARAEVPAQAAVQIAGEPIAAPHVPPDLFEPAVLPAAASAWSSDADEFPEDDTGESVRAARALNDSVWTSDVNSSVIIQISSIRPRRRVKTRLTSFLPVFSATGYVAVGATSIALALANFVPYGDDPRKAVGGMLAAAGGSILVGIGLVPLVLWIASFGRIAMRRRA